MPDHTADAAEGWYFNTRLEKFKDKRVREAFIDAFDFEWANATIMYGAYQRTQSYFEKSDMKAVGRPGPDELAILEPFRGKVPDEVFGEPFVPPVSDGSGQDRALLRKASMLLQDARYVIKDGKRTTPQGEAFVVEFLTTIPFRGRVHHLHQESRERRHDASVRVVDPVQYRKREDEIDFELSSSGSASPARREILCGLSSPPAPRP